MPGRTVSECLPSRREHWLKRAAYVIGSILRMVRINDFEHDVVARFQVLYNCVELVFGSGWVLIDPDDYEIGLETLQIGEGSGAHGLDDHARDVQPRCHLVGDLADDETEFFACLAAVVRCNLWLLPVAFRENLIAIADGDGGVSLFSIAQEAKADAGAGVAAGNVIDQVVAVLDGAAINRGNDVARLHAGLVGGTAGLDLLHENAILESINAIDGAGKTGVEGDADRSADDFVAGADEVVVDGDRDIRGHREPDPLVARRLSVDGRIHANDLAVHVEQRAAGVSGVDGSVGLNEVLELAGNAGFDGAVLGGDDAGGNGLRECEGAADGFNPIAHLGLVRVAQFDDGQRGTGFYLDDSQVGGFICAYH